jgi:hypothetical protein
LGGYCGIGSDGFVGLSNWGFGQDHFHYSFSSIGAGYAVWRLRIETGSHFINSSEISRNMHGAARAGSGARDGVLWKFGVKRIDLGKSSAGIKQVKLALQLLSEA